MIGKAAFVMEELSIRFVDRLIREGLVGLLDDLSHCNWYVREHEIVNLFVFKHLVPAFIRERLDLTMIGIECPVAQVPSVPKGRPGARKDLVIWAEPMTTVWKGCESRYVDDLSVIRKEGSRPFAILEWKNISRRSNSAKILSEYKEDVEWLKRNRQEGLMRVGYAILVDQTSALPSLKWRRFAGWTEDSDQLPNADASS